MRAHVQTCRDRTIRSSVLSRDTEEGGEEEGGWIQPLLLDEETERTETESSTLMAKDPNEPEDFHFIFILLMTSSVSRSITQNPTFPT